MGEETEALTGQDLSLEAGEVPSILLARGLRGRSLGSNTEGCRSAEWPAGGERRRGTPGSQDLGLHHSE